MSNSKQREKFDDYEVQDEYNFTETKKLEKVCSDYSMSASDVYTLLISKNDADFPLSFEIVKYKVLKDIPADILKNIFTLSELKSIFSDTNIKKIKNPQIRKLINSLN